MPKRSGIAGHTQDENQLAKAMVNELTVDDVTPDGPESRQGKNLAAVALGRLGGLKGGKARALKLSAKKRKAIAKKAAEARWSKAKGEGE